MRAIFLILVLKVSVLSSAHPDDTDSITISQQGISTSEKFEYIRKEPGNELGIFTKVIAQIYRKANQTAEEYRLNRAYLPDDTYEHLMKRCDSEQKENILVWSGCVSDDEGLSAIVTRRNRPDPKSSTFTYLELEFKPFRRLDENGEEEVCILDEVYKNKAFIAVRTVFNTPSNDSLPRGVVESVAAAYQHQLDEYGEHFLSIFGDKIDPEAIYNFGEDEYYDRDPPYECFLSIGSSESVEVIREKCDFYCPDSKALPAKEIEKVLLEAKSLIEGAQEVRRRSEKFSEEIHDEL